QLSVFCSHPFFVFVFFFFFQAEDGIRDGHVTGVQTCALPILVTGLATWTVASSAGLAALLVASQPLFLAVRLAGAAYLIFLGIQALHGALFRRHDRDDLRRSAPGGRLRRLFAYRQGLFSNLSNPTIVVFFLSLCPQFVTRSPTSFLSLLLLGAIFCSITLTW